MKIVGFLALLTGFAVLSVPFASAQTSEQPRRAPEGATGETLVSIYIPPLVDAPFTATVNTEWTRHLEDGTSVTIKNHRTIARDGAGRIFQERRYLTPDGDKQQTAISQLEFSNPTTHEIYFCHPDGHICELHYYYGSASMGPAATGANDLKSEDLGHDMIGGFDTLGTRETTTIAPGTIGNDRPLAAVKEFWYSPQLGVNLEVKRADPRSGIANFHVVDIRLGEPDPRLFDPPSDFTIADARRPAVPSSN